MKKNVASQSVSFCMLAIADGAAVTSGTPTVYVTKDNGTQATGTGTSTHKGNGEWSYVPEQAETNADIISFMMTLSGAVSSIVNIYTTYPQSVDISSSLSTVQSHGDATWATATGFATPANVSAVQTHGDSTWATATGFSTHSVADVVTAVFAKALESGYTLNDMLLELAAVVLNKCTISGTGPYTLTYRNKADDADAITLTIAADGSGRTRS